MTAWKEITVILHAYIKINEFQQQWKAIPSDKNKTRITEKILGDIGYTLKTWLGFYLE